MIGLRTRPERLAWMVVAALALIVFVVGCGSDDDSDSSGDAPTKLGENEDELNLVAWIGYTEDGSTEPAEGRSDEIVVDISGEHRAAPFSSTPSGK